VDPAPLIGIRRLVAAELEIESVALLIVDVTLEQVESAVGFLERENAGRAEFRWFLTQN
jgi:hypothetical protein